MVVQRRVGLRRVGLQDAGLFQLLVLGPREQEDGQVAGEERQHHAAFGTTGEGDEAARGHGEQVLGLEISVVVVMMMVLIMMKILMLMVIMMMIMVKVMKLVMIMTMKSIQDLC